MAVEAHSTEIPARGAGAVARALRREWPIYLVLLVATVLAVGPFLWMLLTAFKTGAEVYAWPPRLLPQSFH